ncbi:ATP-dependent DNA helicase, partial [Aureobasidium melanogenum]
MPILHYPTLDLNGTHWILGLAIVTIGSHMSDFEQSEEYALCFDEFLRRAISALDPHELIDRITLCQAKLLACINQIYSGEESWQESAYHEFLTDLISFCQLEWKMSETGFTTSAPEGQEAEFWKRWVQLESCRRTGYAIWMLDTMWAYQFQVQPRLTLEDGRMPLPCQEVLWETKGALQWHHIFQFSPSNLTLLSSMQSLQNEKILQNTMGEFSRIILLHGFYRQCWELEKAEIQSQPRPQQMSMYTFWSNSTMESLELLQWSANSMVAASGLREEMANRGLSATSIKLKKELIARLQQDDKDKADASSAAIKSEANPQSSTVKAEADIDMLLREKFGYPGFRGEQEKAILSLLRGENTLAIFPTGAGKSLCYQIPAIAFPLMDKMSGNERPHGAGLTLVVSPLIALMKDQTDALKNRGIAADCSDSTKTYEQHQQIHADIHAGKLRLLYVSPEKLSNEAFVASMKHVAGGVRLVAVDEAHCISEWGHSFRPTYLMVERFTKEIKVERVICLTATATPKVAEDVRAAFDILERNEFRTSPYRPNLRLEAVATDSQEAKLPLLFKWLREHPDSTIVYVTLQQQAEDLCKVLRQKSFNAAFYHAGMKVEEKTAVQDSFMADKIRIVVATIAFGMGIDKSDIRGVVHLDLPSTVEEYSQQVGRAGRDGEPGYCIMFICHSDIYLRQNFSLGDLPSRKSLLGLLKDVFGRERTRDTEGEVIKLAHRELSTLYDIRLSPLGVVFAALELRFGLLRAITPEYTSYQFEDKGRYHAVASSDHSPEARAIYSMSTKAIKNFTFDMNAATRRGLMRADLVQKLDSWNATGVIMLKTSGVMNRYRVLSPLPTAEADIQALADDLFADMAQREKDALGRIDQMVGLITGKSCLALGLAQHFGMELPDGRLSCVHCTYCAWGEAATLAPKPAPPLNVEGVKRVLAACPHDDPRLLARVAFGIKSPRITQLKLDKSSVFESLKDHEFSTLLREFEAACRTAAHGPLNVMPAPVKTKSSAETTWSAGRSSSTISSRGRGGSSYSRGSSNGYRRGGGSSSGSSYSRGGYKRGRGTYGSYR